MSTIILQNCGDEQVADAFSFENFSIVDNDSNEVNISVRSNYRLSTGYLKNLRKDYGRNYKDSILLPVVISVSRKRLLYYSLGDIYNYKRHEIEQILEQEIRVALSKNNIHVVDFHLSEVVLSNELRNKLEKEHLERTNK